MSVIVTHTNGGFFSCCSVRLNKIVDYINIHKQLPLLVDSSVQFSLYKQGKNIDITLDYFEDPNNCRHNTELNLEIETNPTIDYHYEHQFNNYHEFDYKNICPLVEKYFSPSNQIKNLIQNIEKKYNLDYANICVLFYRGNDKNRETKICGYTEYIIYAKRIIDKNPNIVFLIQSDETEFIEFMKTTFPQNSFYMKDEIRHMKKCDNSVDIVMSSQNDIFSKYYLAITIIMSRCKYIVCGSGNCSMWIILYRGNSENVYQNLHNRWIEYTNDSK